MGMAKKAIDRFFYNLDNGVFLKDSALKYVYMNPAFAEIHGVDAEEVLGKRVTEILDQENAVHHETEDRRVLETGEQVLYEKFHMRNDGIAFWFLLHKQRIILEDGARYIACKVTDITALKEREAELKQRETELEKAKEEALIAGRAKSQFLANMSHEIRTPMNGVMGIAELLGNTELDTTQQKFVDIIVKSGDALLTIINDILDFSKLDANQMELDVKPFDLRNTVEDVATLLAAKAEEKDLQLNIRLSPKIPAELIGDQNRLRQILLNLVGNAIKFTDKGTIRVTLQLIESDGVNAHIRCAVSDTGEGIPQKQLHSIFNAFEQASRDYTRKETGSGLGLAISKQLVEMMHGKITVESMLGMGSTFTVDLPKINIVTRNHTAAPFPSHQPLVESTIHQASKGEDEMCDDILEAIENTLAGETKIAFQNIITVQVIPALQLMNLPQLDAATHELKAIADNKIDHPVFQLCVRIEHYTTNLSIDCCRKLRTKLIAFTKV